jgi:2,4-dienoyl-CoA reductase-like NADH-dependent reductase (Old Yellow Enzyme family)
VTPQETILQPLAFRTLTVKNRLFRSSLSGRFDNYDGSGTEIRINWDVKFAKGGVGTIISSNTPVHPRGLIVPNYSHIDRDELVPFYRELVRRVHEHDCSYIIQIAFSGRQRDVPGIQYEKGLSSTDKREPLHGFECERMTHAQIREIVDSFGHGARRAREAGADGVEVHGCNGYLITQFLSRSINDRKDEYGGSLENRARFALEVVRAIRREVGEDYHVQFKISPVEHLREIYPWLGDGNTLEESIQVCKWLEEAGVDAFHVSTGGAFPHPRNPPGKMPLDDLAKTYDSMISSGRHTLRNLVFLRTPLVKHGMRKWWEKRSVGREEGINLPDSRAVKQAVGVPVICAGGFQTASVIARAIEDGSCDGVSMARPLLANPTLPRMFEQGLDRAPRPCTYSNKCLVNFVENPLGCYDETRYDSREQMIEEIMSVYELPAYVGPEPTAQPPRA